LSINFNQLSEINRNLKKYPKCSLLIVSKNRDPETIKLLINEGYLFFGENRVQEAEKKFSIIGNKNVVIHLIGPLQSNKVKTALKLFSTIQTIDRPKLVSEISKHLNSDIDHQIVTRDFYIQVNIGKENQKSGVLPNDLPELYDFAIHNKLKITGLMCIPPFDRNPSIYFEAMNVLKNSLNKNLKLSMGMSNDYEIALNYQSDLIRVGSKIFE
tara:strand:- start:2270 stop:2908 length:639 start_codon:yes stop_codon:yes gene_type:complete